MTDENTKTPGQQDPSPGQQASEDPTTDWESRFKGLQKKFSVLMETKSNLEGQLAEKTSLVSEKETQLASLSNERDSVTSKTQKEIDELNGKLTEANKSLSELSQVQLKVKVANDLGHPEILQLIDTIPDSDKEEDIKSSIETILSFAEQQVAQREKQLGEGLMPGESSGEDSPMPSSEEGWSELIDSLPMGSDERNKAFDSYFKWTQGGR